MLRDVDPPAIFGKCRPPEIIESQVHARCFKRKYLSLNGFDRADAIDCVGKGGGAVAGVGDGRGPDGRADGKPGFIVSAER